MSISLQEQIDNWVEDNYPDQELLLAGGFEEAFIGVATQFDQPITVFDRQKCIEILMRDMSEEEAYEYFSFNVEGAYVGKSTPAFVEFFEPNKPLQNNSPVTVLFVQPTGSNLVFGVLVQDGAVIYSKLVHDRYDFADGVKAVHAVEKEESMIFQLVEDKHPEVTKYLREEYPAVFDK